MRKYIIIFLFISFSLISYSQVIKGTIFDQQTNNSISFASIYFSGTFDGIISDQDGNFELDITKHASRPLTISAVGYYSYTLTEFLSKEPLVVYLIPKIYEIKEVAISSKSLSRDRKANLKIFKNAFLGKTKNARKCKIMNEEDITFNYGFDSDTLKAYAREPILIHNGALGYNITYYLDEFEYYKKSGNFFFNGNIIFNEDLISESGQKQSYYRSRKYAYSGSRMNFFRALWADDLKSTKFSVKNLENKEYKYKDIVFQSDNYKKFLKDTGDLHIYYFTKLTKIKFLKEQVFFDKIGFFDPLGINWEGVMGRKRIADWLPYEYSIEY